ncbi:MAG: HAMP domain-containing sensor histidine kinase [Wenzhouxiangellaceae bacterium]|nr:HAMP domain-containing sensor histidine kinase [Wenzhouxiangellaceae bacterium]
MKSWQSMFQRLDADSDLLHRSMNYMALFRLVLAGVIVFAAFSAPPDLPGPEYRLVLGRATGMTYLLLALALGWQQLRPTYSAGERTRYGLIGDAVILMVVMHCFGGLGSGLAVLLLFIAGMAGLLLPIHIALGFASLIAIGLVFEAWLAAIQLSDGNQPLQAAIFGMASFATVLACSLLGQWGRQYQALAERRRDDLVGLEQVNEMIIRRMRSGVIVVDPTENIRQMNESAWYLLGNPPVSETRLSVIAPALLKRIRSWEHDHNGEQEPLLLRSTGSAVVPQFVRLPGAAGESKLIFLEDTSIISRRARELAQASLARLSASIAHEIRNPLGALSHAAQLLGESAAMSSGDARLIEIIRNHALRMNEIVENVLKLSRRETPNSEHINLSEWLRLQADELRAQHGLDEIALRVEAPRQAVQVCIDPGQMAQAVANLVDNALRHAGSDDKPARVILRMSPIRGRLEVALDVIDNGPGIPPDKRAQVFEPFFTTHRQGSGLGLFLTRQLCDANQAPLEYVEMPNAGACFRILMRRSDQRERPIDETPTGGARSVAI